MAQTLVNLRMDEDVKKSMEETCKELGITMSAAFNMFARKMSREKRIPFEVSIDPFYSESNMKYLKKVIKDIESGKAKLVEHELMEDDEWDYSGKNKPGKIIAIGKYKTKRLWKD